MLREKLLLLLMHDALDDKSDRSSSIHKPWEKRVIKGEGTSFFGIIKKM
jgi:hypothetical protein